MSRKKKAPEKRPVKKEERDPSPFDSIVLKEKKEPEKKKTPAPQPKKRPGEIVFGYNPSDSFADILDSFEKTGNPYRLPQSTAKSSSTSFGDILSQWEGKGKKKTDKKPQVEQPKVQYKATKSFADILDQYEGVVRKEKAKETPKTVVKKEEKKPDNPQPLFIEESEEDKPSPDAVWSVIGGLNKNFVRKEEEKKVEEKKPEEKKVERVTPKYVPSKSFSDILASFNGEKKKEAPRKEEKVAPKKEEFTPPEEPNFFLEKDEEIPITSNVVWSVMGGANENFVRPIEPKKEEIKKEEVKEETEAPKSSYTPSKSFSEILSSYDKSAVKKDETDPSTLIPEPFEAPEEPKFFMEEDEENRVGSNIAWSIVGGANKSYVRKEEEKPLPKKKPKEEKVQRVSKPFQPTTSFNEVLSTYEKKKESAPAEKTFEEILKEKGDNKAKRRTYTITELRRMDPQATLDLHGETQKDSEDEIRRFISSSVENGLRKISIITGKGLHSEDGQGVLRSLTEKVLSECEYVSDFSNAPLQKGGSGAIWVILKAMN